MRRFPSLIPFAGVLLLAALVAALAGVGGSTTTSTKSTTSKSTAGRLGPVEPAPRVESGTAAKTTTRHPSWAAPAKLKLANGNVTKCGSAFSGAGDAAGKVYHACGSQIHIRSNTGVLKTAFSPGETLPIGQRDVAVNSAGTIVYYTVGQRKDTGFTSTELSNGTGSVHRAKLVNGKWVRDKAFKLGPFDLWGSKWGARYLTVGTDGTLYISVNQFVFAYDAAGRRLADHEGQYNVGNTKISTKPIGGYDNPLMPSGYNIIQGIASSYDGRYLYVVEQDYDHIARLVRDSSGAWVTDKIAGTPQSPSCAAPNFSSPYDIATLKNGQVLVANTTCGEIRYLDATLATSGTALRIADCNLCFLPHGIAVAANGAFVLPYKNEIYKRS